MTMSRFPWGKVIDRFSLDFDGEVLEVVKYHENVYKDSFRVNNEYETEPSYHAESLNASHRTLDGLVVAWIAKRRLGLNQTTLVAGINRALGIEP